MLLLSLLFAGAILHADDMRPKLLFGTGEGSYGFVGFEQNFDGLFVREDIGYSLVSNVSVFNLNAHAGYEILRDRMYAWNINAMIGSQAGVLNFMQIQPYAGLFTEFDFMVFFAEAGVIYTFGQSVQPLIGAGLKFDLGKPIFDKYPDGTLKLPPDLVLRGNAEVGFDKTLKEDGSGSIRLTIENTGAGKAMDMRVDINPVDKLGYTGIDMVPVSVPTILASNKITLDIPVKGSEGIVNGIARYRVKVIEPDFNKDSDEIIVEFRTRSLTDKEREAKKELARLQEMARTQDNWPDIDTNSIPAGSSEFGSNTIAIVIGNKNYGEKIPPVEFALFDAARFGATLERTFGIPKENIWLNKNLTKGNFDALFGSADNYERSRLYRSAVVHDKAVDLIVYYSGHGAPSTRDQKGYFVPVDADPLSIDVTGYGIEELNKVLKKLKDKGFIGKTMVVIDACFSGDSAGGKVLNNISPIALKSDTTALNTADSITFLSTSEGQVSSWYREKNQSLFTYFLMQGLAGAADKNGDRKITVGELRAYLRDIVSRYAINLTDQEQVPQIIGRNDDEVIVELK
jgi:hypothetical protein